MILKVGNYITIIEVDLSYNSVIVHVTVQSKAPGIHALIRENLDLIAIAVKYTCREKFPGIR